MGDRNNGNNGGGFTFWHAIAALAGAGGFYLATNFNYDRSSKV